MTKKRTVEALEEDSWSEEEIDENDLTQLPDVDRSLAIKLKREGYISLWDVAYAEAEYLLDIEGITIESANKMIIAANELIKFDA